MTSDERSDSTLTKVRATGTAINSRCQGRKDPRVRRGSGMATAFIVPVILAGGLAFAIVSKKTNLKATSFHRTWPWSMTLQSLRRAGTLELYSFAHLPSNPARIFLSMYPKRETDSSVRLLNIA